MSQQRLTESQEKTQQRIAPRKTRPDSAQSFHGGLHPILQLQRTLGNRSVAQLIQAKRLTPEGKIIGLQRKLTVGAADDPYEQEADRVARQVMNTSDAVAAHSMQRAMSPEEDKDQMLQPKPLAASITPFMRRQTVHTEESEDKEQPVQAKFSTETSKAPLQRQPETEEDETEPIQAKSAGSMSDSFEAGADVETQVSQSKGRGSPLPDAVRTYMEPRFGVDFSHVRVHTGSDALQMNQAVGAQAFTHGSDIYFGAGNSPTNLELTAHELTHVVQQTGGAALTQDTSSVQRQQQDVVSAPDAVSKVPVSLFHDSAVLHLQRSPGNRFVQRLLAREMAAGERTGEAPVEGVPVQEVGEAAAPDLSQVNENGEIDGAITSNVYPHVFVNGGKTGSAMVHWVGGTGGSGQPARRLDRSRRPGLREPESDRVRPARECLDSPRHWHRQSNAVVHRRPGRSQRPDRLSDNAGFHPG